VSNTSNKINLNRLNNGLVIVEMLPPVDTSQYGKEGVRALATHCRELMAAKIAELDKEVAEREAPQRNNTGNAANSARIAGGKRIPFLISQYFMELICHSVGVSLRLQA
jgi:hypothetical protein